MRDIILLYGNTKEVCQREMDLIKENVEKGTDVYYVLDSPKVTLSMYIDYIFEQEQIDDAALFRLKICNQIVFQNNVTCYINVAPFKPKNMKELLELLNPGETAGIVIENNDRVLLANILQQLIYIDYPITEVNLMLRKEFAQIEKTKRFMANLDNLRKASDNAVADLKKLEDKLHQKERYDDCNMVHTVIDTYQDIAELIEKACNVEMKLAVVASKKTGKSVIVNCMLGQELAPTSLEMATPNTCIYRKSKDDKFHIAYDKNSSGGEKEHIIKECSSCDEVFNIVKKEFKDAQNSSETRFAIPDMEISYVSTKHDFDSYTIYDTPGPDAAGTDHSISAEESLQACDAAIFAIDYSKYLTESEEKYLKQVKNIFDAQQKFHTLIFDINKIDLALGDKDCKSRIKSIDFIRHRLSDIDPAYKDCVVFATSAQDYFYTCELQNHADKDSNLLPLLDQNADWYEDIRRKLKEIKSNNGGRNVINTLSNLISETDRLEHQLDYLSVNMSSMRQYSGMPQLMAYAKYIMQSKAREEIVNSITHRIGQNFEKLRTIIAKSDNIKTIIDKTQEELAVINGILCDYQAEVKNILEYKISEQEISNIQRFRQNKYGLFCGLISQYRNSNGVAYPLYMGDIIEENRKKIEESIDIEQRVVKPLIDRFIAQQQSYLEESRGKIKNPEELVIKFKYNSECNNLVSSLVMETCADIESIRAGLERILAMRFEKVAEQTEICKQRLKKENCPLSMPGISAWPISIPSISVPTIYVPQDSLEEESKSVGKDHALVKIVQIWRNLCDWKFGRTEVRVPTKKEDIDKIVAAFKKEFEFELRRSEGFRELQKLPRQIGNCFQQIGKNILDVFQLANDDCLKNITIFTSIIDDRGKYAADLEKYQQTIEVYNNINEYSSHFLNLWNEISTPSQEDRTGGA